jgi:hypothetical protein
LAKRDLGMRIIWLKNSRCWFQNYDGHRNKTFSSHN